MRAPLSLTWEEPDGDEEEGAASSDGERERGVEIVLGELDPCVAAMDGDEGGSGERVKYTTLAREPPICEKRR